MKKVALGVLFVLALLFVAVRSVEVDATAMGRSALSKASASTGLGLDGAAFHFNLLRGLRIEGIEAGASFPSLRYDLTIPEARFEHRLAPLLRRQVAVEQVVLKEPRVELVYGLPIETEPLPEAGERRGRSSPKLTAEPRGKEPRGKEPPPEASPDLSIALSQIVILDGTVRVLDASRPGDGAAVSGLDLTLSDPEVATGALTLLHAITASGVLATEELQVGDTQVRDVSAALSMAGGRIDLEGEARLALFVVRGSVHLDFNSLPFRHRISVEGPLAAVPGVMSLDVAGFGLDPKNLKGAGRLAISEGRFGDSPFWDALGLVGEHHGADDVSLTIAEGRVVVEGSWLEGWIDFEGGLELAVRGEAVSGTWERPVVSRDGSSRSEAPRSAPREVRRGTALQRP